ncbi:MAG: IS481 family transposase [Anaerolineae bacterium]|nr:IS481 family transposase [Anaerolineae bacterium]
MPWKESSAMEERIRFVVLVHQEDRPFSALCEEFGVSRQTGYKWLRRYEEAGSLEGLAEASRRPHTSPQRTPAELEARVVQLRERHAWGARKIKVRLEEEGILLGEATINRILSRKGLVAPRDRHRPATKRFCRQAANELWQMDFKGHFAIVEGLCHPLSILDDHSRFLVASHPLLGTQAKPVHERLVQAFQGYGLPQAMLMDHGSPWWSTTNALGLTWVSVALIKQGICLHFSGVGHPQTQGKVERLHGSLAWALQHLGAPQDLAEAEAFLATFRHDYNHLRPHESLDMDVPAQHYQASPRPYNPTPAPWHYPPGVEVLALNSQGMLPYQGRRYFVCEALACEPVGVQRFDDKLLVSFRHMFIRQIDLATKHTVPLVQPVSDVSTMS